MALASAERLSFGLSNFSVGDAEPMLAPSAAPGGVADQPSQSGTQNFARIGPEDSGFRHSQFMHPWFSQATDNRHDREDIPQDLVRLLLLDESFQPGERPTSVINAHDAATMEAVTSACLTRSQRVFKECGRRTHRKKALDKWHNAGGNRSKRPLPSADSPLLWRWYGAIEQLVVDGNGTITRMTTWNYHAYRLAEHVDCTGVPPNRVPVLYHIFTSFNMYKLEFPHHTRRRRDRRRRKPLANSQCLSPTRDPSATPLLQVQSERTDDAIAQQKPQPFDSGAPTCAALALQTTAEPRKAIFMSFAKGDTSVGGISLNTTGGVTLQSRGGDVAEWHELQDHHEALLEGDIVAIVK